MERKSLWTKYTESDINELEVLSKNYIDYISENKTERECTADAIKRAQAAGYISLEEAIKQNKKLETGDKIYAQIQGKSIILVQLGKEPMENGLNILGAHVDSPRLDIKQNPVFESADFALLDTHYYGGIKKYQWVATPLALHGVIIKKTGEEVTVNVGEDPADPVFCVTDLLPHLGRKQMTKPANEVIEGENLDILVGNRPMVVEENEKAEKDAKVEVSYPESLKELAGKEPVKAQLLMLLHEKYGIEEEDLLSAELEIVPAGRARECGFDRSMVLGYGQDDKVCAFTSLEAQLDTDVTDRTAVCILVDKEEIGSVGATGMKSLFFENTIAEIMDLAGEGGTLPLRRCLANSAMLSSDVSAGFDPAYAQVFESKNTSYLGRGLVFNKYTGAGGKSGSNDARPEYIARLRAMLDEAGVGFQTSELGRVDAGGGGTIAYILATYGMDVIDSGVAVLSMHAPWEVTSKADIYEAYKGYKVFLQKA